MLSGLWVGNVRIVLKPGTKCYGGDIWGEISLRGLSLVLPKSGPFLSRVRKIMKWLDKLKQRQSNLCR